MIEGRVGTPERPLSDIARIVYLSWWRNQIISYMKKHKDEEYTILDIEKATFIRKVDIMFTLDEMKMLKFTNGRYYLITDPGFHYIARHRLDKIDVHMEKIHWVPYVIPKR